jgi:tetratricopeptide (TPR) repeat protein
MAFFPLREDREFHGHAPQLPEPLRLTCERVQAEMDDQDPVAAVWAVKDAWECAIRYAAALLFASASRSSAPAVLPQFFAGGAFTLGKWAALIQNCARALPPDDPLREPFCDGQGAASPLARLIQQEFVPWRNRVHGHGVFHRDRAVYAADALTWSHALTRIYEPLARISSQRAEPILTVRFCPTCNRDSHFFLDQHQDEGRTARLLDYRCGGTIVIKQWAPLAELAAALPPGFVWERAAYDGSLYDLEDEALFRTFDQRYRRPSYAADAVWRALGSLGKGYLRLTGDAGTGKSWLVRGLVRDEAPEAAPVLAYHVASGARTHYATFVAELEAIARQDLRWRTPGLQFKASTFAKLRDEFAAYLGLLKEANQCPRLILAIDGIDELPDPNPSEPDLLALLPEPRALPDGVFVLLSGRPELRPAIAKSLALVGEPAAAVRLDRHAPEAVDFLRDWVSAQLEPGGIARETVAAVVERSDHRILYASHLVRALEAGVFSGEAIPAAADLYAAYLQRIEQQVGEPLFRFAYAPLLRALCAAREPVNLARLQSWMFPSERAFRRDRERLRIALLDLRDFLRVTRVRPKLAAIQEQPQDNWFELEHEEFRRFLETDPAWHDAVAGQHSRISEIGERELGSASYLETDPAAYHARFLVEHLRRGSDASARFRLMEDPNFHQQLLEVSLDLLEHKRFALAADVVACAIRCVRHCLMVRDSSDSLRRLGDLQARRAFLLHKDNRNLEALQMLDEAMATWKRPEWLASFDVMDEIASIHSLRGVTLHELERNEEAVRELDESIRIRTALPPGEDVKQALAVAHANRSRVLESLGRLGEAEVGWRKAISAYESLRHKDSRAFDALCASWRQLAGVLKRRGKDKQAGAALEKAEKLLDNVEPATHADVLLERGDVDAGLDLLRREVHERHQWHKAPDLARTLVVAASDFYTSGNPERTAQLAGEVAELLRIPDLPPKTYAHAAGLSSLYRFLSVVPPAERNYRQQAIEWAGTLDSSDPLVRAWQEFLASDADDGRFPFSRGSDRVPVLVTKEQLFSGQVDLRPSNDVLRTNLNEFRKK